jgi:hypothetical protein
VFLRPFGGRVLVLFQGVLRDLHGLGRYRLPLRLHLPRSSSLRLMNAIKA